VGEKPRELIAGLYHWTAHHPGIDSRVSSYYVEPAGAVLDPIEPEDGWEALPKRPKMIVLTSGHHGRDARQLSDELGIPVRGSREADKRLGGSVAVTTFEAGEKIAPVITGLHVGVLCPDEGALLIAVGDGALAIADGITTGSGSLGFFSDELLGDDPEAVKQGLAERYSELLELEFDNLLFAHGEPVIGRAKAALRDFITEVLG
jgi:hypothetical protein